MATRVDLVKFVNNVIAQHPDATRQDLEVQVRNGLQDLKKNGTKISNKEIAQAQHMVRNADLNALKANYVTKPTAAAGKAVRLLNESNAGNSYKAVVQSKPADSVLQLAEKQYYNMTKKERAALSKFWEDHLRTVFGYENVERVPQEDMHLKNNTSRKASLIAGTKDLNQNRPASLAEHIENLETAGNKEQLNKVRKEMAAINNPKEYVSAKKQKKAKKQLEIKNKKEHYNARAEQFKINRDRRYCTKNGIMTTEAKKHYDTVKEQLSKPSKVVIAEPKLSHKSAKESFEVFMQKAPQRLTPVADSVAQSGFKKALKGKWALVASALCAVGAIAGFIFPGAKNVTNIEENIKSCNFAA